MVRTSVAALAGFLCMVGLVLAADKEVNGTVVKVDVTKNLLAVKTDSDTKVYQISDDTKFLGPNGGESLARLKDDRLTKAAGVTLIVAGNNKTVREVRLPRRKSEKK
jgi:hypothetical protein